MAICWAEPEKDEDHHTGDGERDAGGSSFCQERLAEGQEANDEHDVRKRTKLGLSEVRLAALNRKRQMENRTET